MNSLTRRRFLRQLGAGGLAAGLLPSVWASLGRTPRLADRDLLGLSDFLIEKDRDAVMRRIAALGGEGWSRDELLGAVHLAGVREVNPDPCGFKFHCVMVVHSAALLADAAPPDEAMLAVLFNASDFKISQARDAQQGDFQLGDAPALRDANLEELGDALVAGLEQWDAAAADRSASSAAAEVQDADDLDQLFEDLWPLGMRDFHNLGHKIIFMAQTYRTLRRVSSPALTSAALRSLALGLLAGRGGEAELGSRANRERARRLAEKTTLDRDQRSEPARALEVLRMLRISGGEEASEAIAAMLEEGVSAASIWDGYRLFSAEQHLHAPGLLAVHPLTTINASRFAADATRDPATRLFLILQSATWQVAYRGRFTDGKPAGVLVDEIEPGGARAPEDLLENEDGLDAVQQALRIASEAKGARELRAALGSRVLRKGNEHHFHKYAAAIAEEHALMHPDLAPRLLAASLCYVPRPGTSDTDFARGWLQGELGDGGD